MDDGETLLKKAVKNYANLNRAAGQPSTERPRCKVQTIWNVYVPHDKSISMYSAKNKRPSANPAYGKLEKVRTLLKFVDAPTRGHTQGIPLGLPALVKAKEWASKQPDSLNCEHKGKGSRVSRVRDQFQSLLCSLPPQNTESIIYYLRFELENTAV